MKNSADATDEAICVIEEEVVEIAEDGNEGCQVRRRIEDYHERRRYKDDLGEFED